MNSFTANVPLRLTSVWTGYRTAEPIPHRYGTTTGPLLQYDRYRRMFVWADHPSQGIDDVLIEGQSVGGWTFRNGQDSTGRGVTFVEFDQAVDEGVTPVATGRGKLHQRTGALITNPADVLWDLLANIAGADVSESRLDRFRAECANLPVAGSIDRADSQQAVARDLCSSVGAIFCADMPALAKIYPGTLEASRAVVGATFGVSADAKLDSIVNDLTINFSYEDGRARESIQVDAPDSVRAYGRRPATIDARWVVDGRVALDVATRYLQQRARPQFSVSVSGLRKRLNVGDAVTLAHPVVPASGDFMVLSRDLDLETGLTAVTMTACVGTAPAVRIVQRAAAFDPQQYSSATITTQGGQRIITLTEEDGSPIANATVTLDGLITRQSDAAGRVSFPAEQMPPGDHSLTILTLDGRTLSLQVTVV